MSYDMEAIFKAYAGTVTAIDSAEGCFDINGDKVTIDQAKVDAARVELNKLNYKSDRVLGSATTSGYLPLQEQLDQLYHDMKDGKLGVGATTGSWYVGISSVKTSFPKP